MQWKERKEKGDIYELFRQKGFIFLFSFSFRFSLLFFTMGNDQPYAYPPPQGYQQQYPPPQGAPGTTK